MPCNNKLYSHRSEMKYFFQAILLSYFVAALANSNLSTKQAKNADNGTTKSSHCNVNNYFYAGPNSKKIEDMFSEVKQQLAELNSTKIEDMFSEVKQQLAELNSTKIEDMFSEVKQQLAELKDEIREMKENQTWCQGGRVYKNCADVYQSGDKISGVYKIDPDGKGEFEVFCDQKTAGGGWTVFQKRRDGSVDFYRAWDDYKRGFGDLKGEFWLGLDKIHRLTVSNSNKLRVDLEDKVFAEYSSFSVASEKAKYKLNLGSYSGTAGDSLGYNRGAAFSTKDRDNDAHSGNCASYNSKGAWWYNKCHYSNLNGLYLNGKISGQGMTWYQWKNSKYSVKKSEMKIRPKDF